MAYGKVYGEETEAIAAPSGIVADPHDAFIPDTFCHKADNFVVNRGVMESRKGFRARLSHWTTTDYINHKFVALKSRNPNHPALIWRSGTSTQMVKVLDPRDGGVSAGDDYMSFVAGETFRSAAIYGDRVYILTSAELRVIPDNGFNWTAGTFSLLGATITNVPAITDIFVFKERMWGYGSDGILYYTEPAEFGQYPETWNAVTQNIAFSGPGNDAVIRQVVILGNKLLVFSTNGLFTLHVDGQPGSWFKRSFKPNSACLTKQCAVENNGVVYFVDQEGVHATNGLTISNISPMLSEAFLDKVAGHFAAYYIGYLDEGLVVSIKYLRKAGATLFGSDGPRCRTFFSRIDKFAWTEWNVQRPHTGATDTFWLDGIMSVSPVVNTVEADGRIQYVMYSITTSRSGSSGALYKGSSVNVGKYLGHADEFQVFTGSGTTSHDLAVELLFESRFTDGAFATRVKRAKNAFLSVAQPEDIQIKTNWILDSHAELTEFTTPTDALSETGFRKQTMMPIPADFMFQAAAFRLKAKLVAANALIPFKFFAVYMVKDTGRRDDIDVR